MNKQRIAILLAGLVCLCAILAAPASAFTEFRAKTAPTEIKDKNKGRHVFSIPGAASPVECEEVTGTAKVTKSKQSLQKQILHWIKCVAFGFLPATVSNAEFEVNANGTASVASTWTIKAIGCETIIEPSGNKALKELTYSSVAGTNKEIEVKANVSGITEKSSGGICGNSGSEATYKGTSISSDSGVDLEVV
jgi:hypothetical protein